jgi:hypothetical protein
MRFCVEMSQILTSWVAHHGNSSCYSGICSTKPEKSGTDLVPASCSKLEKLGYFKHRWRKPVSDACFLITSSFISSIQL